jgi:hypothetical protein
MPAKSSVAAQPCLLRVVCGADSGTSWLSAAPTGPQGHCGHAKWCACGARPLYRVLARLSAASQLAQLAQAVCAGVGPSNAGPGTRDMPRAKAHRATGGPNRLEMVRHTAHFPWWHVLGVEVGRALLRVGAGSLKVIVLKLVAKLEMLHLAGPTQVICRMIHSHDRVDACLLQLRVRCAAARLSCYLRKLGAPGRCTPGDVVLTDSRAVVGISSWESVAGCKLRVCDGCNAPHEHALLAVQPR